MIAFSSKETSVLIIPAMAVLAAGGIAVLITNMQVGSGKSLRWEVGSSPVAVLALVGPCEGR